MAKTSGDFFRVIRDKKIATNKPINMEQPSLNQKSKTDHVHDHVNVHVNVNVHVDVVVDVIVNGSSHAEILSRKARNFSLVVQSEFLASSIARLTNPGLLDSLLSAVIICVF